MSKITFGQLRDMLERVQSYENYMAAICPFHEDEKPSLLVFKDGWFRCLACGVSGGYEKLHRKLLGWDASRVVREATAFSGPTLPRDLNELEIIISEAHEALLKFDQFQWYLKNRGVAGRIESCRLGWWNGWYTIPIFDPHMALKGAVLRANSTIQQATGQRFLQPPGQRGMMYCPNWHLYNTRKALAVVFGMFDALAVSDLSYAVVTSTSGKDSFKAEWLDGWRKRIVIFPDDGEYDSAMKLANSLGWRAEVCKIAYPDDVKDPAGFLETGRRDHLNAVLGSSLGEN